MKYAIAGLVLIVAAGGFIFWWRKRQADKLVTDAMQQGASPGGISVAGSIGGNMGGGGGLIGGTAASLGPQAAPQATLTDVLAAGGARAANMPKPQILVMKDQPAPVITNAEVLGTNPVTDSINAAAQLATAALPPTPFSSAANILRNYN